MIITKKGKYRLIKDYRWSVGCCVGGILRAGSIINITNIDDLYHHVFSPELGDWNPWDLPVEEIFENK